MLDIVSYVHVVHDEILKKMTYEGALSATSTWNFLLTAAIFKNSSTVLERPIVMMISLYYRGKSRKQLVLSCGYTFQHR